MAVQAQYPANVFRSRNNVMDEIQQFQNLSGNLFGSYTNYGRQPILNGAAVFSEPESELTCNVSASRKRNRDSEMPITHHQPYQQQQISHHFRYAKMQKGQVLNTTSESRLHESGGTSTSGRSSSMVCPTPSSLVSCSPVPQDLNSHLLHQNLEIDALILLHNEKLRSVLEETRKRHCRSLVSSLEQQVLKRLEEKETELQNASRRNAELEEKIKQISAENQIWFNVAKNNEAIVSSLKSTLEEILHQNNKKKKQQNQGEEGFGDSEGLITVYADDAQSCCEEEEEEEEKSRRDEKREVVKKHRKSCKVCCENEVSVLVLPCRHLCLCKECESKLDYCPICNSIKNASLQIFMS